VWLGQHTLRAVGRWQQQRGDARRLVLIGHSLGSAALVRALTEPALSREVAAVARRIDGLVLIAQPDVLMEDEPETLRKVAELSDLEVRAAEALGILDREMADATHAGVVNPLRRALEQEAERLGGMLRSDRTRHPAQAMLKRFVPLGPDGRPLPEAVRTIVERQRSLAYPVLLVWGGQDDTLPFASAAVVAARLPRVERLDVPDARHSPHQERADLVAWAIARFLSSHRSPGRP
jgi:pimeloyl-ACP methyl ester carboxylesterase